MAVGGELIGALLHTSDHSPDHRRGLLCGVVAVFGSMGNLLGSIVSVGMRHALSEGASSSLPSTLSSWSVCALCGGCCVGVGVCRCGCGRV